MYTSNDIKAQNLYFGFPNHKMSLTIVIFNVGCPMILVRGGISCIGLRGVVMYSNMAPNETWARFLCLARGKLRLC